MTLSQLIAKLQALQSAHGSAPVVINDNMRDVMNVYADDESEDDGTTLIVLRVPLTVEEAIAYRNDPK